MIHRLPLELQFCVLDYVADHNLIDGASMVLALPHLGVYYVDRHCRIPPDYWSYQEYYDRFIWGWYKHNPYLTYSMGTLPSSQYKRK